MKQYIDKSAVVAELESKIKEWRLCSSSEAKFRIEVYKELSEWLNTLEVKEVKNFIWNNARTTVPEDSTNQIICIKEDGLAVSTIGKIVNGTVKWAYLDDLLNTNSFNVEVKEVDLEKEIDNYVKRNGYDGLDSIEEVKYIANHFAKWQKAQTIDKACELLARMIWEVTYEGLEGNSVQHYDKMEFIEDIKNYLKGE